MVEGKYRGGCLDSRGEGERVEIDWVQIPFYATSCDVRPKRTGEPGTGKDDYE
jgi:hypothetical protein